MENTPLSSIPKHDPPLGMFNGRLDDKGRLKVPTDIQTYLDKFEEKRFFVTSIDGITAQIYPITYWREQQKKLTSGEIPAKIAKRIMFSAMDFGGEATMDSQGRITFNSELRTQLDMNTQALRLYTELDHIEILTEKIYKQRKDEALTDALTIREEAEGYGLK